MIYLATFEYPVTWGGRKLDRKVCDSLQVGDIVRIMVVDDDNFEKFYVHITKIDRYKKGGIHKPRKFYGKTIDMYLPEWYYLKEGEEVTFRKENIYEIPNWKYEKNPLHQERYFKYKEYVDLVENCRREQSNKEYEKEEISTNALYDYIRELKKEYNVKMKFEDFRRFIMKELNLEKDQMINLYKKGHLSNEKIHNVVATKEAYHVPIEYEYPHASLISSGDKIIQTGKSRKPNNNIGDLSSQSPIT